MSDSVELFAFFGKNNSRELPIKIESTMEKIKRPSIFLFLTEIWRAVKELMRVLPFIKKYKVQQKGDGHTVFIIPGLLASDTSTKPLRKFLDKIGYKTLGWGLGTNLADLEQLNIIAEKVNHLYDEYQEPISLIGWSLGGVYAREIAKEHPEKIRQVITLGSPFNGIMEPNNANITFEFIKWLKGYPEVDEHFVATLPNPAPVPSTAIYSKKDGIVPWQTCMEKKEDATHQNIECTASHLGMGANIQVLEIIADRLNYAEKNWVRYGEEALFIGSR